MSNWSGLFYISSETAQNDKQVSVPLSFHTRKEGQEVNMSFASEKGRE